MTRLNSENLEARVLAALKHGAALTITEVATRLGVSRGCAHRVIHRLADAGQLVAEPVDLSSGSWRKQFRKVRA